MDAGFGRHPAEGVLAGEREGHALQARFFARLIVEQLALEAAPLRPLQVHAQQHLGPVLRLGAAGARMDRDDGVGVVVLAAQHLLDLGAFDLLAERVERLRQIGRRRLRLDRAQSMSTPMSSILRASWSRSSRSSASRRRRCSVFCASAGSFQKSGAATRCSSCASSPGSCAPSKITPHVGCSLEQIGGASNQFVNDQGHD